jgi:hypothetical protein
MKSRTVSQSVANSIRILCICMFITLVPVTLCAADRPTTGKPPMSRSQRIDAMKRFLPQLRLLAETKSGDIEIQVGLATMYGFDRSEGYEERFEAQFKRVLELDLNNKTVRQLRVYNALGDAFRMWNEALSFLEPAIDNAKKRGAASLFIPGTVTPDDSVVGPAKRSKSSNSLRDILADEIHDGSIEAKDFDQALAKMRQAAEGKLNLATNVMNEAEEHDPQNAWANYQKARLYFMFGHPDLATRELQTAVAKPFVQEYFDQGEKAALKALEAVNAPPALTSSPLPSRPLGGYITSQIWRPYVEPLVTKMEDEGNFDQAKEINNLSMGLAKHIREEPRPYDAAYNKTASEELERRATERSNAIDKHKAEKAKRLQDEGGKK